MSSDPEAGALDTQLPPHVPVQITADVVRAGSAARRFREGDARSLLEAYLTLIRGLREQRRARTIELRSTDIESLAAHLGVPGSVVVEQLADLMGATRSQRLSMVTLFGAGALVIGLAGSATAAGPGAPQPAERTIAPAVVPVATTPTTAATTTTTGAPPPTVAAPTTTAAPPPPPTAVVEVPPEISDQQAPSTSDAPAAPSGRGSPTGDSPTTEQPPADTVVTDIGTPPIPPTTTPDTSAPDTTAVTDIGTPPIPPTTTPDTSAPDTTAVTDIGTPPIPPTTTIPTTDPAAPTTPPADTVVTDIGTPPVPPTSAALAG